MDNLYPPVSHNQRDKLILQPQCVPPVREHRHPPGLHHGTALKHQNYSTSTFCINATSATPLQHKNVGLFFVFWNLRTPRSWMFEELSLLEWFRTGTSTDIVS